MAFQPGTWIPLPSNCTRSYTVTFYRCASWGIQLIAKCVGWAEKTTQECISWGWKQVKKCSWWSWIFCVLFAIIVTAVCLAFGWVVSITCTAIAFVEIVVCLVWSLISIIFCISKANGGTAWYLLADDEGDGYAKKANRDFQFFSTVVFIQKYLLGTAK